MFDTDTVYGEKKLCPGFIASQR